jgi:hypothetical protein
MHENIYDEVANDSASRRKVPAKIESSEDALVDIALDGESSNRLENRKSTLSNEYYDAIDGISGTTYI